MSTYFLHRRVTAAMRPDSADTICSLRHHAYYLRRTAGMAQWQLAGTIIELQPYFSKSQLFNAVGIRPSRPDNNLVWAILSTILFCLPLGLVGVYYSMKVDPLYLQGKYEEAQAMAKKSLNWSIAGCITGIVLAVIYAILSIFLMPIIGAYLQNAIMSQYAT